MKKTTRKLIEARLNKAASLLEEALRMAKNHGWPEAEGFCAGEGPTLTISIIESMEIRDSMPPTQSVIYSSAREWDCGAW